MSLTAADFCAAANGQTSALSFDYREGDEAHSLALAGRAPITFPRDAGGRVRGGSASWVEATHRDGAIHEPGLVGALLALDELDLQPRTVLDIGSLYGYVSLLARSIFDDAEVHAFEANPRSYRALRRNVEANRSIFGDSVEAHLCALSDVSQRDVEVVAHLMRIETEPGAADANRRRDHIDVWTLDDFCAERSLAPDLVKIDVEGYQAKIIPGSMAVIERHRPVILLEFDGRGAANDFGVTNRDVIRPLVDLGYHIVWGRHRSAGRPFTQLDWHDLGDEHELNSLAVLLP
ncbi:FkbM family methyltransferase [Nocardioides sp. C4-1]|uniref:FkbM family methyltransferase n=1 Tax=Nocardioides sp. C4-1 TaxID=3151851 RepID=UPI003263FCEE